MISWKYVLLNLGHGQGLLRHCLQGTHEILSLYYARCQTHQKEGREESRRYFHLVPHLDLVRPSWDHQNLRDLLGQRQLFHGARVLTLRYSICEGG